MAQVKKYPFLRQLRADASSHIQHFNKGTRVRSGRGLAFWFYPDGASISEIPMDDRDLPFLFKGQTADYQDLSVQGSLIYRVSDPEMLGDRVDFTIDLATGLQIGQPLDQIGSAVITLVRQFVNEYVRQSNVRNLLEAGNAPVKSFILGGLANDDTMAKMGLEMVSISIINLAPSSELSRALQTPTLESLQQQADEAVFARRALAVEKESAIAENELNNKIELASRQKALIAREDENARSKAETSAATIQIRAVADAERIRVIEQANADMEKARVDVYSGLEPQVMLALAAQEFASTLEKIDSLTVTPDMISGLLSQMRGAFEKPAIGEGK